MNSNAEIKAKRHKSPSAPSLSLEEAIGKALKIYEKEKTHSVPVEVAARGMGYTNAQSGSAARSLASLKMYGLLISNGGKVAISPDVEEYKLHPNEAERLKILRRWIENPKIYNQLLKKYASSLPSDAAIKYELVREMKFKEDAAEAFIKDFRSSLHFAQYSTEQGRTDLDAEKKDSSKSADEGVDKDFEESPRQQKKEQLPKIQQPDEACLPIHILLARGRIATLKIPLPFYEEDKKLIQMQLDIIRTEPPEVIRPENLNESK